MKTEIESLKRRQGGNGQGLSDDLSKQIGERLEKIRRSHGISPVEWCGILGCTPEAYELFRTGVKPLGIVAAVRVCRRLGIRLEELLPFSTLKAGSKKGRA